jgi:hypothetical protein
MVHGDKLSFSGQGKSELALGHDGIKAVLRSLQ